MSEPKRYDPPDILSGESFMQEVQGGDYIRYEDYARIKAEVERLTKAVIHSPAAQLKLTELQGKVTYDQINGKVPPCIDRYEAK